MDWIGNGYNCTRNKTDSELNQKMLGVGVSSDLVAIFGSLFIIVTYFIWTDLKTRARKFLFIIAVADFLNAATYLFGQIWSLFNLNFSKCYIGKPQYEIWFCVASGAANNFFSLCSFTFTILLSVHVVFLLFGNTVLVKKRIFTVSVFGGFAFPFLVTSVTFWGGWYGPGNSATVGTCFIRDFGDATTPHNIHLDTLVELLSWYLWGLLTDLFIFIVYLLAVIKTCKQRFKRRKHIRSLLSEQDSKLLFIPVAFLAIRIWGDIHLLDMYLGDRFSFVFLYFQAFFAPGQGWANFFIFVVLTAAVRNKLLVCCRRKDKIRTEGVEGAYSSHDRAMSDLSGSQVAGAHPYELFKD